MSSYEYGDRPAPTHEQIQTMQASKATYDALVVCTYPVERPEDTSPETKEIEAMLGTKKWVAPQTMATYEVTDTSGRAMIVDLNRPAIESSRTRLFKEEIANEVPPELAHLNVRYLALAHVTGKETPEQRDNLTFWEVVDQEPLINGGVIISRRPQQYQESFCTPHPDTKDQIRTRLGDALGRLGLATPEDADKAWPLDTIAGHEIVRSAGFVRAGATEILGEDEAHQLTDLLMEARINGTRTF